MSVSIELRRFGDAGMIDLVVCDNGISETMRLVISGGQPWEPAYREAECLAIALDCSFYVDRELKRLAQKKENRSYKESKTVENSTSN